jgi:hypothetical protein
MTFLEFLDSLPWWLTFGAGVVTGSIAMYGPARKWGEIAARRPRRPSPTMPTANPSGPTWRWTHPHDAA